MAKELARFIASKLDGSSLEIQTEESDLNYFLTDFEFTHAIKSKRLAKGDSIEAYIPETSELALCEIKKVFKTKALLKIKSKNKLIPSSPFLKIYIGLPSLPTAEIIIEKLQEIGAAEICFFIASRTQGRRDLNTIIEKQSRWNKIAISAFKQSKQSRITKISFSQSLEKATKKILKSQFENKFFFSTHADPVKDNIINQIILNKNSHLDLKKGQDYKINSLLEKDQEAVDLPIQGKYLVIGPEGGLSKEEETFLNSNDFRITSLGDSTLRVETAAILTTGVMIQKI